jgi:hypothetical protein
MVEGHTNWTYWKTDTAWTNPGGDFGGNCRPFRVPEGKDLIANPVFFTIRTSVMVVHRIRTKPSLSGGR